MPGASIKRFKKIARPAQVLRGAPLNYPASVSARYHAALRGLIDKMTAITKREIERMFDTAHFEEYFAEDMSVAAQARILTNRIRKKFEEMFDNYAQPMADKFAGDVDRASQSGVKMSLKELSKGISLKTDFITGELKETLSACVTENVSLIKSIADKYLTNVQGAVMRSIITGNGLADLVPYLERQKGVTQRRAKLISYDQTRKAYSALNTARCKKLGVEEFEWLHSGGGQHPRKLHITRGANGLNGNIYRFDDPPIIDEKTGERGLPAQMVNCKCKAVPIIRFEEGA